MPRIPVPGAEDLWPHVSQLDEPANELHGEMLISPRALGLLIAPSVEEFTRVFTAWHDEQQRVDPDAVAARSFPLPPEWQQAARRRSKELQARYNSPDMIGVLRGLHREYGVLPPEPVA